MDIKLLESKMLLSLNHFTKEINGLRTGRASESLVDNIQVDAYGSKVPINQIGNISIPEPRMITIQVPEKAPMIMINPNLTNQEGLRRVEEGCLSVIDFRVEIQRAEKITVEYQDVTGEIQKMEAEEMMSICLQHEIDHLNGVLFIDHLPLLKQKMVKKRLKKLAKVEA